METENLSKQAFVAVISIFLVLMLIGTATFAWFTSNTKVSTSTVSGRSGTRSLTLLIGSDEQNLYDSSDSEVTIEQVNTANPEKILPVSTADLETFVYANMYSDGKPTGFAKDTDEKRLWHGKIYLKMQGENVPEDTQYNLYLDTAQEAGGEIGQDDDGELMKGARLGFKFEDDEPVIVRFDDMSGDGSVLDGDFHEVSDPSIDVSAVSLDSSAATIELPDQSLMKLPVNQTVGIDVYFYIEGCDTDSVDAIAKKAAEMHLAFYAVAE